MLDKVEIRLINKLIKSVPVYSTDGSAGLDLRAAIDDKINLGPNETILIPTGLSVYIKTKIMQLQFCLGLALDIKRIVLET